MAKKTKEERQAIRAQAEADKGAEKTNKKLAKAVETPKSAAPEQEVGGNGEKFKKKLGKAVDKSKETRDKIHAAQEAGEITKTQAREQASEAIDKFKKKGEKLDNRLNKTGEERRAKKKLERGTEQTNKKLDNFAKAEEEEEAQAEKEFGKANVLETAVSEPASELTAKEMADKAATKQVNARMFDETKGGISAEVGNKIQEGLAKGADKISALNNAVQQKRSGNGFAGTTEDISRARNASLDNSFAADSKENRGIMGLMNRYSDAPAAAEKITNQDLFADVNAPLQRGTYSGRTTGSVPIFVGGGGYVPLGIIDSRNRALNQAAKAKAKKGEELAKLVYAQGAVEYQDQINDMSNELLEDFGASVGYDWDKLNDGSPRSLEFFKAVQDNQAFASQTKHHHTNAQLAVTNAADNTRFVPDLYLDNAMEYLTGTMNLDELRKDPKRWKQMNKVGDYWQNTKDVFNKNVGGIEKQYEQVIADQMNNPEVATELKDAYAIALSTGDFTTIVSATRKLVPDDRLKDITDGWVENSNLFGTETDEGREAVKDAMFEYTYANLGKGEHILKSTTIKNYKSGGGSNKEPKVQLYTDAREALMSPNLKDSFKEISNRNGATGNREASAIQAYEDETHGKIIENNGGRLQSRVVLTPTQQNKKVDESAVNVEFYNDEDNKYYSYDDMLAQSLARQKAITEGTAANFSIQPLLDKDGKQVIKDDVPQTERIEGKKATLTPLMSALANGIIDKNSVFNGGVTEATTELSAQDSRGNRRIVTGAMAGTNPAISQIMYPTATTNYGASIDLPEGEFEAEGDTPADKLFNLIEHQGKTKKTPQLNIRYRRITDMRPPAATSQLDSGIGKTSQDIYSNTTNLVGSGVTEEEEVVPLPQ